MLTGLQAQLHAHGYVVSPNNIHGLPGIIMHPAGPGVPSTTEEVQVTEDTIRVFNLFDQRTIALFTNVPDFIDWCPNQSEGGVPAHPQNWD